MFDFVEEIQGTWQFNRCVFTREIWELIRNHNAFKSVLRSDTDADEFPVCRLHSIWNKKKSISFIVKPVSYR